MVATICAVLSTLILIGVVSVQWRAWRPLRRHRVVLVLDTGRSMTGILVARRGSLLELAEVTVATESGTVPADGRVVVERARVEWLQVID